ncbi:hypothetical protein FA95DRAFT_1612446 [Auriscalpium vulgare]|uniref:Uncharacterized protein n=1 Tax=Auriscalpium vulgare TaxID=40419 RepID=A0ACB8R6H4_9AGAM|nr:hypothetical protein FA95DRAFT_1612446 [Auriscalpium vulgare]
MGQPSTVHAEAGMMALACAFSSPDAAQRTRHQVDVRDDDNVLTSIFNTHEAPIGVSKRCCYCCWALYTWLQEHKGFADAERKAPVPDILLPGSHATIFPWYPPQFGIPIEFLRDLLRKLMNTLAQVAAEKGDIGNTQTSARSSRELDDWHVRPEVVRSIRELRKSIDSEEHSGK